MNPFFSVITPVYNKLPHLERSVQSVIKQTYKNFELILIDDASTDGSAEKLLEFEDDRIKILRRNTPGPGGYAARNLGIAHATAAWVCFLDADDEWDPSVLETVSEAINNSPDAEIVCWGWYRTSGGVKTEDKHTKRYKEAGIRNFSLTDFFVDPQTMWMGAICLKKQLIEKAGTFPERGFKRGGDFDTWIRCMLRSKGNVRICRPMSYYHVDSVNMVTKNVEQTIDFLFTPHLLDVVRTTKDIDLRNAILRFQNKCLYQVLNRKVYEGNPVNYKLIKRMNLSKQALWLFTKLHLNKIRLLLSGVSDRATS